VSELITDVPDKEMLGLNIVEFAGDDAELIESQVTTLCQRLDELIARGEGGVIGWQLCNDLAGIERIYAMRKKAVGLLGNAKGPPSRFPLPKIPACRRSIWRIISLSFARCWTATA
jgi:FAD/FMN-containing dehydrogenase